MNPNVIAIVGICLSSVVGIIAILNIRAQNALKSSVDALNRSEDKREQAVAALGEKLHAANEKLIDERFRAISHKVREETNAASLQMQSLGMEAKRLEDKLTQIVTSLPQRELDGIRDLVKFKDELRACMTSKDDFREFREATNEKLDKLADDLKEVITLNEMRELLKGLQK